MMSVADFDGSNERKSKHSTYRSEISDTEALYDSQDENESDDDDAFL